MQHLADFNVQFIRMQLFHRSSYWSDLRWITLSFYHSSLDTIETLVSWQVFSPYNIAIILGIINCCSHIHDIELLHNKHEVELGTFRFQRNQENINFGPLFPFVTTKLRMSFVYVSVSVSVSVSVCVRAKTCLCV